MITASEICSHLNVASPCHEAEDGGVIVNSHCLYPSNGTVLVYVREVASGFIVSDGGGAMRELVTSGVDLGKNADDKCMQIAMAQGLTCYRGIVQAPTVPIGSVALAIIMVANASKEIADVLFAAWKPKREKDFKKMVRELLTYALKVKPTHGTLFGKTNKQHKFDNVFTFPNGKRAAVDAVATPDGMVLVPASKLRAAAATLDRDGDEYGVAADLLSMLSLSSPQGASEPAGWQPIETAPQNHMTEILAFKRSIGPVIVRWLDADHPDADGITEFHESWNHQPVENLTHWRPLPAPPSGVKTPADAGGEKG